MAIIRKTITMDEDLYNSIQKLRGAMMTEGLDMSFTTTINVVLVSGILGAEKFDDRIWTEIASFFQDDGPEVEIEELIDNYTEYLLGRLKKLKEMHSF